MIQILVGCGLSAAIGFNAWIPFLVFAGFHRLGLIETVDRYMFFTTDLAITLYIIFFAIDFVINHIPGLVHLNDTVGIIARPIAGGIIMTLCTIVLEKDLDPLLIEGAIPFLGLCLSTSIHLAISVSRPILNAFSQTLGISGNSLSSITVVISFVLSILSLLVGVVVFFCCCLLPLMGIPLFGVVQAYRSPNRPKTRAPWERMSSNDSPFRAAPSHGTPSPSPSVKNTQTVTTKRHKKPSKRSPFN